MQTSLDENRIIEMAWEDRTTFDSIKEQFGLRESEVIKLMRNNLKRRSFKLWRSKGQQAALAAINPWCTNMYVHGAGKK